MQTEHILVGLCRKMIPGKKKKKMPGEISVPIVKTSLSLDHRMTAYYIKDNVHNVLQHKNGGIERRLRDMTFETHSAHHGKNIYTPH